MYFRHIQLEGDSKADPRLSGWITFPSNHWNAWTFSGGGSWGKDGLGFPVDTVEDMEWNAVKQKVSFNIFHVLFFFFFYKIDDQKP